MHELTASEIGQNLAHIQNQIRQTCLMVNRRPETVRLIGVSKFHPQAAIINAIQHQQFLFGENRIQEAKQKFTDLLTIHPQINLHLIGPVQSNKLVDAVSIATTIQTVDRPSLLDPLEKAIQKTGRAPTLFIQVNTGKEPQKAGILPEDADHFITLCCKRFDGLVKGIMGIPPVHEDPEPHFRLLTALADKYHLPERSMGMSGDFRTAIQCGATMVRIGSAIFGERPLHKPVIS